LISLIGGHGEGGGWKDTLVAVGGKVLETVAIAAGTEIVQDTVTGV
jgi:Na+/glutamate symporter